MAKAVDQGKRKRKTEIASRMVELGRELEVGLSSNLAPEQFCTLINTKKDCLCQNCFQMYQNIL
jgi:hypothetical protein